MWLKEISPSDELRKWFSHKKERWEEFKRRYKEEMEKKYELIEKIKNLENEYGMVTLLFSAKDKEHNNAVVLKEVLIDESNNDD